MSIHTVEWVLFEVASTPEASAQYKADTQAYLAKYPLTSEEARLILELDVAEMVRQGINPMLTMRAFNAIQGRDQFGNYLKRLKEM